MNTTLTAGKKKKLWSIDESICIGAWIKETEWISFYCFSLSFSCREAPIVVFSSYFYNYGDCYMLVERAGLWEGLCLLGKSELFCGVTSFILTKAKAQKNIQNLDLLYHLPCNDEKYNSKNFFATRHSNDLYL